MYEMDLYELRPCWVVRPVKTGSTRTVIRIGQEVLDVRPNLNACNVDRWGMTAVSVAIVERGGFAIEGDNAHMRVVAVSAEIRSTRVHATNVLAMEARHHGRISEQSCFVTRHDGAGGGNSPDRWDRTEEAESPEDQRKWHDYIAGTGPWPGDEVYCEVSTTF